MSECEGLEATIRAVERIGDFDAEKELATLALKLLFHCLKLKVNRR